MFVVFLAALEMWHLTTQTKSRFRAIYVSIGNATFQSRRLTNHGMLFPRRDLLWSPDEQNRPKSRDTQLKPRVKDYRKKQHASIMLCRWSSLCLYIRQDLSRHSLFRLFIALHETMEIHSEAAHRVLEGLEKKRSHSWTCLGVKEGRHTRHLSFESQLQCKMQLEKKISLL